MSALPPPTTIVRFYYEEPDSVSEFLAESALGVTPQSSSIVRLSAQESVYCIRDPQFHCSILKTLLRLGGVRTISMQIHGGFGLVTLGTLYWLPSNQPQHPYLCSRLCRLFTSLIQKLFCADRKGRIDDSLKGDMLPLILDVTAGEPCDAN